MSYQPDGITTDSLPDSPHAWTWAPGDTFGAGSSIAPSISCSGRVRAAFTWTADDPDDTSPPPLHVYAVETSSADATGRVVHYTEDGEEYLEPNLSVWDSLLDSGDEDEDLRHTHYTYIQGYHPCAVSNPQRDTVVHLPWRYFTATASGDSGSDYSTEVSANVGYGAWPANLQPQILVRRRDSTRLDADKPYSTSAKLAAGNLAPDEHWADVKIKITTATYCPTMVFPGVVVDPLQIIGGEGVSDPDNHDAVLAVESNTTDSNGQILGTFHSSNMMKTVSLNFTRANLDEWLTDYSSPTNTTANMNQIWNDWEGRDESWDYLDYFDIGAASPVTYKMRLEDAAPVGTLPITTHHLGFKTTGITGLEWQPNYQDDDDEDGIVDYVGAYVQDVTYTEDDPELAENGKYAGLVTYDPVTATEDPLGDYTSNQTVNDFVGPDGYIDFYTDSVTFDAVDDNAYADVPVDPYG